MLRPAILFVLSLALIGGVDGLAGRATVLAQVIGFAPAEIGVPLPGPLPLFPADNWWNQDISQAPVDPRSAQFIVVHQQRRLRGGSIPISAATNLRAASTSTAFPYVVVAGSQPKRAVAFYYADESDGVDHATGRSVPFYPIPDEAIAQPYWIEGGYPGNSGAGGDRHMLIVDRDNRHLYELFDLRWNGSGWTAGSGAFFDLNANTRRPETWTSADAAGLAILPGLVRYDEVFGRRRDPPRVSGHGSRHQRLRVAGIASRRQQLAGAADGRAAAPQGEQGSVGVSTGDPEDLPRHAALRPDRRRQRIRHVRQRRVRSALEQRHSQSRVSLAHRQRFRSDPAGMARRGGGPLRRRPAPPSPFSFSQSGPIVVLVWAAAAGAQDYVIEVGSAPGLSNMLVAPLGATTTLTAMAPPGRYYARIRARNACGSGAASNEIVVL